MGGSPRRPKQILNLYLQYYSTDDESANIWDAANGQKRVTLTDQGLRVGSAEWSPDGSMVVTTSSSNIARIWGVASGRVQNTLRNHDETDKILSAKWSLDGSMIITTGDSGIKIWDAASGQERSSFRGYFGVFNGKMWSPNGSEILIASDYTSVQIRDAVSGQERVTLRGHTDEVRDVEWIPDGSAIATASMDGTAKIWDTASGRERITLRGHTDAVWDVEWSPDGSAIATASMDNTAKIWDAASGQEKATLHRHTFRVHIVKWSPDGSVIVTASDDGTVKIWDASSGQERVTLQSQTEGENDAPNTEYRKGVNNVLWSPDGTEIVTVNNDSTVRVYVIEPKALLAFAHTRVTRALTTEERAFYLGEMLAPAMEPSPAPSPPR